METCPNSAWQDAGGPAAIVADPEPAAAARPPPLHADPCVAGRLRQATLDPAASCGMAGRDAPRPLGRPAGCRVDPRAGQRAHLPVRRAAVVRSKPPADEAAAPALLCRTGHLGRPCIRAAGGKSDPRNSRGRRQALPATPCGQGPSGGGPRPAPVQAPARRRGPPASPARPEYREWPVATAK